MSFPLSGDSAAISTALLAVAAAVTKYGPLVVKSVGRMEQLLSDIRDDTRITREAISPSTRVRVHRQPERRGGQGNA